MSDRVLTLRPRPQTLSNEVSRGRRTVVLSRGIAGASADHFSFPAVLVQSGGALSVISTHGSTRTIAQHPSNAFASSTITLAEAGVTTCVCRGGGGSINGIPCVL